jgi:predicted DNA-binding transcriptional regulator AlpA
MPRTIITKKAVQQRTGLSDTTIWRLEKAGDFPARIQITRNGRVGWHEHEVDAWVHERVRGAGKRPPGRRGEAAPALPRAAAGRE